MTGAKKRRGRPREFPFFKSGAPVSGRRPLSVLMQALKTGHREFFGGQRQQHRAGPYVSNDMISELLAYSDGDPSDDAARDKASRALTEAKAKARSQSEEGTAQSARPNRQRRDACTSKYAGTFQKVRAGKLTANSGAIWLRQKMRGDGDEWIPSLRTLNAWLSDYRAK